MSTIKLNLEKIVSDKIIPQSVANDILSRYTVEQSKAGEHKFLHIFTTIGAIVTGIWIILLVWANWKSLEPFTKTILLIGATLWFYAIWYYMRYVKQNFDKTGEALILLGSISYWASIFLLWQIYNVWGDFSTALLLWTVWILPLAYISKFSTIFALSLFLIYAFAIAYIWEFYSSISGFMVALIIIVIGYINLSLIRYHDAKSLKSFSKILWYFWIAWVLWATLPFTFNSFWIFENSFDFSDRNILYFILIGVLIGLGNVIFSIVKEKKFHKSRDAGFFFGAFPIVLIALYTAYAKRGNYDYNQYDLLLLPWAEGIYVIIMNFVYLALIAYMILTGIKREKTNFINLGIIFFGIYLFSKYISFIATNKMDGAIVFITWWIACILIWWLSESLRRKLVKKISQ